MFIRSIRESNFDLFVRCVETILPWTFSLDHINYARWMSVFLEDLKSLPLNKQAAFQEFCKGKFTISKTNRKFSNIAEDHAHEQNNKVIKDDGGAIGLFDTPSALQEWATTMPYIADIIEESKLTNSQKNKSSHHEDTDAYEEQFRIDQKSLISSFKFIGNPFTENEKGLVNIFTNEILPESSALSVVNALQIGKDQMKSFIENSLYSSIKKNKLELFRRKNNVERKMPIICKSIR